MQGSARLPVTEARSPKPVVLIVIDGLTPSMLEATDEPALRFLLDHGSYRRAVSTFPSLTPVCLASIATGGHADVHEIPHLVWWNRDEQRLVEYGSRSRRSAFRPCPGLRDTVVNLNERHLSKSAETVYEALEGLADDRCDQHHDLPRPAPASRRSLLRRSTVPSASSKKRV
jgi:hypothetical protein